MLEIQNNANNLFSVKCIGSASALISLATPLASVSLETVLYYILK